MAVYRTCLRCALQGLLLFVNFAVPMGLTLDVNLTRQEITTCIGEPVNLGCYVNQMSSVHLTFSWTKDNLTVSQSSNTRVYRNVLVVTPEDDADFGTYECHVSDNMTVTKCSISLNAGCNNRNHVEENSAGCGIIAVLMPVLAVTVVSMLLNAHFLIRWKRRDEWALSEEAIMQLQLSQQSVPVEEKSEEHVEVKKKKPFRERFRKHRPTEHSENNQHIEEKDKNHTDILCEKDTQEKNRQETIEMQEIHDIPSVADIRAADETNVETAHAPSNLNLIPVDMDSTPRIADFFVSGDETNDETAPVLSDPNRIPIDAEETPRFADFFVPGDETDGDASGRESLDSEMPLVSHYMERMDFEEKEDADDEPVVK